MRLAQSLIAPLRGGARAIGQSRGFARKPAAVAGTLRGTNRRVDDDWDDTAVELASLRVVGPVEPAAPFVSLSDDSGDDLLASVDALGSGDSPSAAAKPREATRTVSTRKPWLAPRFAQRTQSADATGGQAVPEAAPSAGGDGAADLSSSDEREAGADGAAVPRKSIPALYSGLPLDRSTKARLLARGETPHGIAGSRVYEYDDDAGNFDEDSVAAKSMPQQGVAVDYCVFCYHGTGFLHHENGALLTKFVSERGAILPKRFTRCCAKHQRRLARTIRRARWMNLIPWHSKLHPKLRFSSLKPDQLLPYGSQSAASAAPSASAAVEGDALAQLLGTPLGGAPFSVGPDRSAPISGSYSADVNVALAEITALSSGVPGR